MSLSDQSASSAISLITTSKWLLDSISEWCQHNPEWRLIHETLWTPQSEWPKEPQTDIRIVAFTPNDALSEHCLKASESAPKTIPTLGLVTHHDELWMKRLLRDLAMGYLTLEQGHDEFQHALSHIQMGHSYVPQYYVKALMEEHPTVATRLSDREKTIAKLLVSGINHRDIANQLHISEKTVSTHKNNILMRLELRHLPDLIRFHDKHPFAFKTKK